MLTVTFARPRDTISVDQNTLETTFGQPSEMLRNGARSHRMECHKIRRSQLLCIVVVSNIHRLHFITVVKGAGAIIRFNSGHFSPSA
jgi:hypothetical protein